MNETAQKVLQDTLQSGLTKLNLSADVKQQQLLLAFITLITKWNKVYNLTAIRDPLAMVSLHLLDSLAIAPFVQGPNIIDIGTGAGIPGIPLAIYYSDYQFVLLDSNAKKTRFVQQAILELDLDNVQVKHNRVESVQIDKVFDSVICRAFSHLQGIVDGTEHLLSAQGAILAMKGQIPKAELQQITYPWSVIPIAIPGINAERCLIQIKQKGT